jgi:DNA-binding LytR/AlgR family response regulator
MIVAVDRIGHIAPLGAGDAALRLKDGTELRVSRSFRDRLPV